MYTRADIVEMLLNGENSQVEFKEDTVTSEGFARELVAFSNGAGGTILLGVRDDGSIAGLARFSATHELEEWVMNVARDAVRPPIIPLFQVVRGVEGRDIAAVSVTRGYDVYAMLRNNSLRYYIRVGSTCREASTEELQRLFQRRNRIHVELSPVASAQFSALDQRRLAEYFVDVRGQQYPAGYDDAERQVVLAEFMTDDDVVGRACTIAGLVLFGESPRRFLLGASVEATAFAGTEESVGEVLDRAEFAGPLVRLGNVGDRALREDGVVESVSSFIEHHTSRWTGVAGAVRTEDRGLPRTVVREAIVNAIVHRDYSLSARPVQVRIFSDRVVILSPGRFPNGITPASMAIGTRAARNPLIVDTMRDYGYVEKLGLGVPMMIRAMRRFNDTEPEFTERDETVVATFYR
ncbi:MAG TPA: ATP-binding protein [Candidatus Baltobacteraceae bacterium]|nr:ATP-binding protein [Candidatus Baltobacteraceae bacterium]